MDGEHSTQEDKGNCNPRYAASSRQQHALSQQLANDAKRRSAKRGTDSHFTLPDRSASEQEIGDVGTGDQQNKTYTAHQHKQRGPYIPRECVIECQYVNAEAHIPACVLPMKSGRDGIQFAVGLPQTDSTGQADQAAQPVKIRRSTN